MKTPRILFSFDNIIATAIVFLIIKYFTVYQNLDFLNPFINTIQDMKITDVVFSKIQNDGRFTVDTNIVLVNIGYLSRPEIAREIEIINQFEPKVIGIDSFFRTLKSEEKDSALKRVLSEVKNLVMASKIHYSYIKDKFDSISYSHPEFTKNASFGFANVSEDLKGKTYKEMTQEEKDVFNNQYIKSVREISPKENINGRQEVFLAVKIAEQIDAAKVRRFLDRGNEKEIVNYRRNTDKYITLDADDVFNYDPRLEKIRGKIVLMGFLGPDLKTQVSEDAFFTPMNPQYVGKAFPDMYGLVIHANVVSMILDESYYFSVPDWIADIVIVVVLYMMMVGFSFLRLKTEHGYEPLSIVSVFVSLFGWFALILFLFNTLRIFVDMGNLFFMILLTIPVYEAYQDSIKPLIRRRYDYFASKIKKTKPPESLNNDNVENHPGDRE
jgi:CHASE2 domain-containing sensor protein